MKVLFIIAVLLATAYTTADEGIDGLKEQLIKALVAAGINSTTVQRLQTAMEKNVLVSNPSTDSLFS